MNSIKHSGYASFKYNQVLGQDNMFQESIIREETYNKNFGDQCHDIFQGLYQKDIQYNTPASPVIRNLFENIQNTEEFKELKERTVGKHISSFVGMQDIVPKLRQVVKELEKQGEKPLNQKQKDSIRQTMRRFIKKAQEQVEETEDMLEILGIGKDNGVNTNEDISDALEMSKRIANDPSFKAVLEMAGRLQRSADTEIQTNTEHGVEKLIGIQQSDDYLNALPEEIANEDTFMLNFVESKLMTYLHEGMQKQDSGPFIICIDESGSMVGFPYKFSRAILFGMYVVAASQNRPLIVNRFCGYVETHYIKQPKDILSILGLFMNGGTDFNVALNRSFEQIQSNEEFKKADIIFLTDGCDSLADETVKKINEIKTKISLKILGLMIGSDYTDTLKTFCDKVFSCYDEKSSQGFCKEAFSL